MKLGLSSLFKSAGEDALSLLSFHIPSDLGIGSNSEAELILSCGLTFLALDGLFLWNMKSIQNDVLKYYGKCAKRAYVFVSVLIGALILVISLLEVVIPLLYLL